jgi:hypothetical protein
VVLVTVRDIRAEGVYREGSGRDSPLASNSGAPVGDGQSLAILALGRDPLRLAP